MNSNSKWNVWSFIVFLVVSLPIVLALFLLVVSMSIIFDTNVTIIDLLFSIYELFLAVVLWKMGLGLFDYLTWRLNKDE